jgi:hypothetical protein
VVTKLQKLKNRSHKARLSQTKEHQQEIPQLQAGTMALIEWGSQKQQPLKGEYITWLTQHRYNGQPFFQSSATGKSQYEFYLFDSDHGSFALYTEFQGQRRLYYSIPDFATALELFKTVKHSLEVH